MNKIWHTCKWKYLHAQLSGMWEFRGFAEIRWNPWIPDCSCEPCKSEEKISAFIWGGGCSVALQTQSNEVQLYFWTSRRLYDWRKTLIAIEKQRICLNTQVVFIAIKPVWGFLTRWDSLLAGNFQWQSTWIKTLMYFKSKPEKIKIIWMATTTNYRN